LADLKKSGIIHPILFSIFPIFFLYANNISILPFRGFIIPLLIIPMFGFSLWLLLRFVLKNNKKAGLIVSVFMILFLFYGHVYNLLTNNGEAEIGFPRTLLLVIFLIPLIIGSYYFVRTKRKLDNATLISNVIASTLVAMVLLNIVAYNFESYSYNLTLKEQEILPDVNLKAEVLPDVYFIMLDGYANHLILKKFFDYDNSEFISFLTENGFYVPTSYTHSNYPSTRFSIPSMLNMDFVKQLIPWYEMPNSQRTQALYREIDKSSVMANFKSMGYEIISFDSAWWGTRIIDIADHNLCENPDLDWRLLRQLKSTTMVPEIEPLNKMFNHQIQNQKREQILCEFSELSKLRERYQGPIFVFTHIMAPHPLWVFDSDGNFPKKYVPVKSPNIEKRKNAYIGQMEYVNKKIQETVKSLLSETSNPTIIIIKSDHGTRIVNEKSSHEEELIIKYGNFHASYTDDVKNPFFNSTSNVNTFRIIFNSFFGGNYEILEDKVFFKGKEIKNWNEIKESVLGT